MERKQQSSLDILRCQITCADAQQMRLLMQDPNFEDALNMRSAEDFLEFSEDVIIIIQPYIELNINIIIEMACWISSSNCKAQNLGKMMIKKYISEEPNFEQKMEGVALSLTGKYYFANVSDNVRIFENFHQACREESATQQAKRIAQSINERNRLYGVKSKKI